MEKKYDVMTDLELCVSTSATENDKGEAILKTETLLDGIDGNAKLVLEDGRVIDLYINGSECGHISAIEEGEPV
ncbi:hypothetical protein [Salipaludibacillus sp. CF4.18]|uniref:hypothetical protein n=1 Tax=Salipaludibacillus sp. CF4.18 TaxID=3373081 RepID=UPI003EE5225B